MLTLALLANERYQSVAHPIKYMAAQKCRVRRVAAAFTLAVFANGFQMIGETLWHMGIFTDFSRMSAIGIGHAIRTVYLFACLYM